MSNIYSVKISKMMSYFPQSFHNFYSVLVQNWGTRGLFRTNLHIYDGAFLQKKLTANYPRKKANYSRKKAPS